MIDSTVEPLISLAQAAADLPCRRKGRKTHVATLFRWSTSGCRGVRLETMQVGATRCTSREALQRFFERLTLEAGEVPTGVRLADARTTARRLRQSEEAGRELEGLGA